jgi:alpha-amylase
MKKTIIVIAAFVLLLAVGCSNSSMLGEDAVTSESEINSVGTYGSDVMLQAFHWDSHMYDWYNAISSNAGDIKNRFSWVWFPPAAKCSSYAPQGYLPQYYYDLNSQYGSQSQLTGAINAIKPAKAIADIVINHRDGIWSSQTFPTPAWGTWSVCNDDEYFYSGNPGAGVWPRGNADSGDRYAAARDLDHSNTTVRNDIKSWMNWLKNTIGFAGWRYDYVKGFDGWYVGDYNAATNPEFSVGELWQDGAPQSGHDDWVNRTNHDNGKSLIFDFALKNSMNNAFGWFKDGNTGTDYSNNYNYPRLNELATSYGTVNGYVGWKPGNSVTFVDNHDTGSTQQHWELNGAHVEKAYALILTHPGVPCVAWDHYFDWGLKTKINQMIDVRKNNGITQTSGVVIKKSDWNCYAAEVGGTVAVKIGPGSWSPGTGWTLKVSGSDYAIWEKGVVTTTTTTTGGGDGSVRTVIFMKKQTVSGQDIFVKGGHDAGLVPSPYPSMSEPITYLNTLNETTAAIKAADASLDWGSESALDWTTNSWPVSWGTKRTYANDGYGEDPENNWGAHWWKFDVMMDGSDGEWYEFKAFMREGSTEWWESDRSQSGTPYNTINHWGKKGYITRCEYNQNWVEFINI